jgi:TctA family transporter
MGPIIEENLMRALTIVAGDLGAVLLRPITLAVLLLALATAFYSVLSMLRATKLGADTAESDQRN